MEKYIIIALILLFGIVYYFDTQSDKRVVALEQSSTFETDQDKLNKKLLKKRNKRSLWDIIISANKNKNYYKDKGIKPPIIKNLPDSDRSQCSKPPSIGEKIITQFAGYVLEYPCTSINSGSIYTYYDEEGKRYKIYSLYLSAALNGDLSSIWKPKLKNNDNKIVSVLIYLKSDEKPVMYPPLISQKKQMKKIEYSENNDLDFYRDRNRIVGYLSLKKDASGHPPAISCRVSEHTTVEQIFNLIDHSNEVKTKCSAAWMLTKDIYLQLPSINSQYAYHFKGIYQMINSDLTKTIISRP